MSIAVTASTGRVVQQVRGEFLRNHRLTITGLSEGANTIPHGLAYTPGRVSLRPGATGLWGETAAPDSTNLYVTVGSGGATAGTIDVVE